MKCCLLILLTLAAYVSCLAPDVYIKVVEQADGIKLICEKDDIDISSGSSSKSDSKKPINVTGKDFNQKDLILSYKDDNTGEYGCEGDPAVYVKFRTCDNCVELDTVSVIGMAVGNLVASVVVGVAVYLIASQSPAAQPAPTKKRSDRQNLIPNEASGSNDHYQRLRHKQPKDEYDVLRK